MKCQKIVRLMAAHTRTHARAGVHTHTHNNLITIGEKAKGRYSASHKYKDCGGEAGDPKRMIEGVCNATFASLESRALTREHLVQELWLLSNQS